MLSQREGVFQAITATVGDPDGVVKLTKDEFASVVQMVNEGFINQEIEMSDAAKTKYAEVKPLTKYTKSLVNNWLRKDPRLNGGSKYQPKNPGSRTGSGDETLKTLKALRNTITGDSEIAAVDVEIAKRQADITKSKQAAKQAEINHDLVPDSLKHLIQQ